MVSDEGDEKQKASAPGETPAAPRAAVADAPDAGAVTPGLSEWTASDARGPLAEPVIPAGIPPPHPYDAAGFDQEPAISPAGGEPPGAPADTTSAPEAQPPVTPRRSLWPVAAGIVLGAVIGAGSAYLVNMQWPGGGAANGFKAFVGQNPAVPEPKASADNPDLAQIKATLADLSAKTAANSAALQKLPAPAGFDSAKYLNDKILALQTTLASIQAVQAGNAAALKAVSEKTAALEAGIGTLRNQTATSQSDFDALRAGQKSLESKSGAPAVAVLAKSLVEQVERGQPFLAEINALDALDASPAQLAILRPLATAGVLTTKALLGQYDVLSAHVAAAAHKLPPGASYWERLKEGAGRLVTIRKTGETSPAGSSSSLDGIKQALLNGDPGGAERLWATLPAGVTANPDAAPFATALKAYAEAHLAAQAIENAAIAALGVKKS